MTAHLRLPWKVWLELAFPSRTLEKLPLWVKEKVTSIYVASRWSKIGPWRNGNHGETVWNQKEKQHSGPLCNDLRARSRSLTGSSDLIESIHLDNDCPWKMISQGYRHLQSQSHIGSHVLHRNWKPETKIRSCSRRVFTGAWKDPSPPGKETNSGV